MSPFSSPWLAVLLGLAEAFLDAGLYFLLEKSP